MVVRNRNLAVLIGNEGYGRHHLRFNTSITRQNIAIIGALIMTAGIGLLVIR